MDKIKIERGSGNVFADLGRPDAEAHLLKAKLVSRIDEIIRQRGLKQVEAAKLLGLSQPDVSRLLRGNFESIPWNACYVCCWHLGVTCKSSFETTFTATG